VFFVSCLSPVRSWSVFLSMFSLFLFVGVCKNHHGVFSRVVCVPFLVVFVAMCASGSMVYILVSSSVIWLPFCCHCLLSSLIVLFL
jgi:hypothetical protein